MATTAKVRRARAENLTKGPGEPIINKETYKSDLLQALNWYNYNADEKAIRSYAEQYIKMMDLKEYAYCISKASYLELKAIGTVGRLIYRDQYIDIDHVARILNDLEGLDKRYVKAKTTVVKAGVVVAAPSIQDRITETARTHAGEIDEQIDLFSLEKQSNFSAKSFLSSSQVSGVVAKRIGEMYKPLAAELNEAAKGKDAQLKEGYSHFTKVQLKKFIAFVEQIIADCNQQVVSAKAQRKPRARKIKPATVVAAKMKPMREFAELKLKSVEPAKIIGSSELWVYTPDKRKLTVYYAVPGGELGVSGMSVTNYDVEKSEVKTLRKPEEFFKGLVFGKRAMANAWKAIKAKVSSPRSRINDEMILLAAN